MQDSPPTHTTCTQTISKSNMGVTLYTLLLAFFMLDLKNYGFLQCASYGEREVKPLGTMQVSFTKNDKLYMGLSSKISFYNKLRLRLPNITSLRHHKSEIFCIEYDLFSFVTLYYNCNLAIFLVKCGQFFSLANFANKLVM